LRPEPASGLLPLERAVESAPILSGAALELGRWVSEESLSSWGSTLISLVPPPPPGRAPESVAPPPEPRASTARARRGPGPPALDAGAPPPEPRASTARDRGGAAPPELWTGADRHARLVEAMRGAGAALLIAADRDAVARWAARLEAARLDGGAPLAARRAAW